MEKPGLELLYSHITSQIKWPQDALVCVLHWNVISSGFKCIGVGHRPTDTEKKTEQLPPGWNQNNDVYVLKYTSAEKDEHFTFKAVLVDDTLIVNFMRDKDEKLASMPVRVKDYIGESLKEFDKAFKNLSELSKRFKAEIMNEFSSPSTSSTSAQKSERPRQAQGESYPGEWGHGRGQRPEWNDRNNPFSVGRADLDPLAQGGGGMLMDPRGIRGPRFGVGPFPVRLPPGAVPPGARFDPFGPVPGPGTRPDPDHMRPPDFSDDMQM